MKKQSRKEKALRVYGSIGHNAFTLYDFQPSGMKNIDEFIVQDNEGGALVGALFSSIAGVLFGTLGGYFGRVSKGLVKS